MLDLRAVRQLALLTDHETNGIHEQHCEVFETNFYDGEKHLSGVAPAPKDGRYFMFNVGTGRFLDVSGSQLQDGIDILVWSENKPATTNQQVGSIAVCVQGSMLTISISGTSSANPQKVTSAPSKLLIQMAM